jgi:CRISPR system Cascade subunit CasA
MFNLITDRWIPVRSRRGRELVSLRTALVDASAFDGLAPEVATLTPAILRQVILPVVLDALGPPRSAAEWAGMFGRARFGPAEIEHIDAYLRRYRERFELFHARCPFGQVAGLRSARNVTRPVSVLIPAVASGNNVPLFSAHTDGDRLDLAPPEAAGWLLHTHCWDTAGIKTGADGDPSVRAGKTVGNPTGPLGALGIVVPAGRTLYDTIMLNLPIRPAGADPADHPQWARPPAEPRWQRRAATGLLDLWTWQARRIRLVPGHTDSGLRVTRAVVTAGDRLESVPSLEPHTAWQAGADERWRPRRHVPGRAAWRDLIALLAVGRDGPAGAGPASRMLDQIGALHADGLLDGGYPLRLETCGTIYGPQGSTVADTVSDVLPLPVAALSHDSGVGDLIGQIVAQAEQVGQAVDRLAADLRQAAGGDPIPWDRGEHPGERVLHALEPYVRRTLAGTRRAPVDGAMLEATRRDWSTVVRQAVEEVVGPMVAAVPPEAFGGRIRDGWVRRAATAEHQFHGQLRAAALDVPGREGVGGG